MVRKILDAVSGLGLFVGSLSAATFYVDDDAAGAGDGLSWGSAFSSLQSALDASASGDTILVAEGTYVPEVDESGEASPVDQRTKTFFINKNITLKGGYRVQDGVMISRNVDMHRSNLSGDIGASPNITDNCYHVVTFEEVYNSCVLDGFYIREGYATGSDFTQKRGAALYLRATGGDRTSPVVSNCRITSNVATEGAVYLDVFDNDDDTKFHNCHFSGNFGSVTSAIHSQIRGVTRQDLELDNCVITKCTGAGAAMRFVAVAEFFAEVTVNLNNCSIAGSSLPTVPLIQPESMTGGEVYLNARNSVFYNPDVPAEEILAATPNAGIWVNLHQCLLAEANCDVIKQTGTNVTCTGAMLYNVDPQFADLAKGVLYPTTGSPLVDAGDPASSTARDYLGKSRPILNAPDLGAYEFPGLQQPVLRSSVDGEGRMVLNWDCLTGETYTIRRTRDFVTFEDFVTGYPSGGTKDWTMTYVAHSVNIPSVPKLFYQVIRE